MHCQQNDNPSAQWLPDDGKQQSDQAKSWRSNHVHHLRQGGNAIVSIGGLERDTRLRQ